MNLNEISSKENYAIYEPKYTDYKLSPYTGLTRESWIDAAGL